MLSWFSTALKRLAAFRAVQLSAGAWAWLALGWGALALGPLWWHGLNPQAADAQLHAVRTWALMQAWGEGVFYPRWFPDLYYGFGYPILNYYAPLAYLLAGLLAMVVGVWPGLSLLTGLLGLAGALGAWGLGRAVWGETRAGALSAALYAFAPYLAYQLPHARGALPEALALALAPWVGWALLHGRARLSPGALAGAALAVAALTLAHNFLSVVMLALSVLLWLAKEWEEHQRVRPAAALWALGALGLGLALSAWLWLPAAAERAAIQYQTVITGADYNFRNNFLDITDLLAPVPRLDRAELGVRFYFGVGWVQLALAGVGGWWAWRAGHRLLAGLLTLGALVCLALMLPVSQPVWEAVPPLAFLQFPSRWLGPAAWLLALLGGAAARGNGWLWGGALAAWLSLQPLMAVLPTPPAPVIDAPTVRQWEASGQLVGATSGPDFLPVGVQVAPQPRQSLLESYATGTVNKLDPGTLPPGTQVTLLDRSGWHEHWRVNVVQETLLQFYMFDFPGWQVTVNGQPHPHAPSAEGFITLWVPPGTHTVLVRFASTPMRTLSETLSGLAGLVWALVVMWVTRWPFSLRLAAPTRSVWATWVVLGAFQWFTHAGGLWALASPPLTAPAMHRLQADFAGEVTLLGYDLPRPWVVPGDRVPVTLYWAANAPVPRNVRVFVHCLTPQGTLCGQSDKWHPGGLPTSGWPVGRYVRDGHYVPLLAEVPPGSVLRVGLWDASTGERLTVNGSDGVTLAVPLHLAP